MGIPKVLGNLGKAVLNRAGFMTERQMLAATTKAGRYARDILASGATLTDDVAESIFKRVLPKGIKAPDFVTTQAEAAADFVTKSEMFTRERTLQVWNNAGGFNFINPLNAKSMITLNPAYYNPTIVAHEFRHHLDQTLPIGKKAENLFDKLMCKFKFYKDWKRNVFFNAAQDKYDPLEKVVAGKLGTFNPSVPDVLPFEPTRAGFFAKLGVTEENLTAFLSAKINNSFLGKNRKQSIKLLKRLIFMMKTEQNAQRAGAKMTRAIAHIKPNESCYADMSAIFHGEIITALQKELTKQRKNYYKSLAGFKIPKGQIQQVKCKTKGDLSSLIDALFDTEPANLTIPWDG